MVGGDGTVTIEVAAELMNVEVRAIREWAAIGSLEIERRGDEEAVHLGQVKTLARSPLGSQGGAESRRGTLRGLLRDAKTDTESIAGLQELARERIATGN
jgi:hypothetical protein